jgi:hypothetical protein
MFSLSFGCFYHRQLPVKTLPQIRRRQKSEVRVRRKILVASHSLPSLPAAGGERWPAALLLPLRISLKMAISASVD